MRGWTLRQAGIAAGVNYMTVSRLEHGAEVSFTCAYKIAQTLGVPLDGGLR
jgi:transcriptional regulator with XRE-family HTH domain